MSISMDPVKAEWRSHQGKAAKAMSLDSEAAVISSGHGLGGRL